jgi:hypothetical protein
MNEHLNDESLIDRVRILAYKYFESGVNKGDSKKDWEQAERAIKKDYRYIFWVPRSDGRGNFIPK